METGLAGKRALVTAASRGLGYAVAKALLAEGCEVAISSRNPERIEAAADSLRAPGHVVAARAADLQKPSDCQEIVQWTVEQLGGIDVLVNNTGGPVLGSVEELDDCAWQTSFELVLLSAVRLSRAALPHLKFGGGVIVNLTSIAAHQPVDALVLSNALRPGVVAVGKTLAKEAAPVVRVNSILTGRFATDRILEENEHRAREFGIAESDAAALSLLSIPMGRYGRPDELAAGVVYLAGDCSSFVTGATLAIDGGEYCGLF